MNKKILSLLLGVLALVGFVTIPAMAGNDRPIPYEKLPAGAKTFISQHFAGQKVSVVKSDKEIFDTSYEVIFANGAKIEFDRKGNWREVDCKYQAVPASIIPKAIADHVRTNHPGLTIQQIEKRKRGGYQVDLSGDIELRYDSSLRFVGYDY